MQSGKNNITKIKDVIENILPGARVVMFGSRARGEEHAGSDYDLLVIVKTSLENQQRLYFQARVRKALADHNILADILIQSETQVELKKQLPGHIVGSAIREGIRV